MKEHGTLFNRDMVLALLAGTKTNTRRVCKPQPVADDRFSGGYYIPSTKRTEGAQISVEAPYVGNACRYGRTGDRIYVKETFFAFGRWQTRYSGTKKRDEWHFIDMTLETGQSYLYAADGVRDTQAFIKRRGGVLPMYWKRPAIFMPRVAARILLDIATVRVERLQDISEADAAAEGWSRQEERSADPEVHRDAARDWYADLWDQINGAGAWSKNPWVWVVSFKVVS